MVKTDINNTTTTTLNSDITDYAVDSASIDEAGAGKTTEWNSPEWSLNLGYYKKIPELKSLKFYYMDFKDLPISHEHLCDKIHNELKNSLNPKSIKTTLKTTVRGGIYTDIVKEN